MLLGTPRIDVIRPGGGSSFDPANPGPIGGTTPDAGAFTALTVSGQSLSGSQATPALSLAATWNTTGNPSLIYGRATNTSSGASSKLIDVALADGSSGFVVTKAGNIQLTGTNAYRQASIDAPGLIYGSLALSLNGTSKISIQAGSITSNGIPIGSDWGGYLILRDSGSSVTELSIKRGAGSPEGVVTSNPGSIYLNSSGGPPYYKNTGTGNTGWVAADISGKLDLTGGTVTGQLVLTNASATGALNLAPTWNNAGTDFAGIYGRVTNTASGASSKLIDIGTVAGGSLFSSAVNGNVRITSTDIAAECLTLTSIYGTHTLAVGGGGSLSFSNDVSVRGNIFAAYDSSKIILGISGDLRLCRAAAATLQLGDNHATTPTSQTIKAHDVTTGNGSDLSIEAGVGSVSDGVVNIGRTTSSRVGFFYANSHDQIDTSGGSASHTTGTGSPVYDDDRFDNYTIAQVVAALRSYGLLA